MKNLWTLIVGYWNLSRRIKHGGGVREGYIVAHLHIDGMWYNISVSEDLPF